MTVSLDMYMTAGAGILALLLGVFFTRAIPFLKRFCIPAPVSGGLAVSLLTLALHGLFGLDFLFDGTIKDIAMMLFFTSVGYQSDLRVLKEGGRPLLVMILLVAVLIALQNGLAVGIAKAMGLDPLLGMAAGSIPMCGGHGTAGGFSPVLEQMGLSGASSITMAAATFGLVAGSLIGGPLGEFLIRKRRLATATAHGDAITGIEGSEAADEKRREHADSDENVYRRSLQAVFQMLLTMALGMGLSRLLSLTGITFPTYFGALIMAALIRNLSAPAEWSWTGSSPSATSACPSSSERRWPPSSSGNSPAWCCRWWPSCSRRPSSSSCTPDSSPSPPWARTMMRPSS